MSAAAQLRRWVRENDSFKRRLRELIRHDRFTPDELIVYQRNQLLNLIRHSLLKVPHYREIGRELGINSNAITIEDYWRLPVLSKRQVIDAPSSFQARMWPGLRFKGGTGGTSGTPLKGSRDLRAIVAESAFLWRQLNWAGFRSGERRIWIRGDMVVPVGQTRPPFARHNHADNMLMMSSFHLAEATALEYLKEIERFNPMLIQAYPSSIAFLARFLDSQGNSYRGNALRAVVTSSETLRPDDRNLIERTFGCRVFDWYGCYEQVAAIGTCEQGNYHLISDYSFVELRSDKAGLAEIIGTAFLNYAMPLIRYQIEDQIVMPYSPFECACGKPYPVVERIVGRMDDYIITPDGRQIGMMNNLFDSVEGILEGQVVQYDRAQLDIAIVPGPRFRSEHAQEVELQAKMLVGNSMRIKVEVVNSIERTARGKLQAVVRKI